MNILKIRKRGKGKIVGVLGTKDFYNYYKVKRKTLKKNEGKKLIKLMVYAKVLRKFNKKILDLIINESEDITLPYKLGHLKVIKLNRKINDNNIKKSINWKETNLKGFKVYYEDPYYYKIFWRKTWRSSYFFRAARAPNRQLKQAIVVQHKDYFR